MANLTDVVFTDSFVVGGENLGSAVTVGPGVPLRDIYQQTKAQGKIAVGGSAATVCAAGGYLQGAGHSAISPLLGLAADNALGESIKRQIDIVPSYRFSPGRIRNRRSKWRTPEGQQCIEP